MFPKIVLASLLLLLVNALTAGELHQAAKKGDINRIDQLLSTNVDIDEKDRNGRTALFLALSRGRLEVAGKLINAGADVVDADLDLGETIARSHDPSFPVQKWQFQV